MLSDRVVEQVRIAVLMGDGIATDNWGTMVHLAAAVAAQVLWINVVERIDFMRVSDWPALQLYLIAVLDLGLGLRLLPTIG